jgi:hypothetical protein
MAKCSVASLHHSIIRASFGIRHSCFVIHNRAVLRAARSAAVYVEKRKP